MSRAWLLLSLTQSLSKGMCSIPLLQAGVHCRGFCLYADPCTHLRSPFHPGWDPVHPLPRCGLKPALDLGPAKVEKPHEVVQGSGSGVRMLMCKVPWVVHNPNTPINAWRCLENQSKIRLEMPGNQSRTYSTCCDAWLGLRNTTLFRPLCCASVCVVWRQPRQHGAWRKIPRRICDSYVGQT